MILRHKIISLMVLSSLKKLKNITAVMTSATLILQLKTQNTIKLPNLLIEKMINKCNRKLKNNHENEVIYLIKLIFQFSK